MGDVSAASLSDTVREYDSQGIHRTGTAVDADSAGWLADRVRSLGLEAELVGYPFRRVVVDDPSVVEVGELVIEGLPINDSVLPPPSSIVSGELSLEGTPGSIRTMRIDQHRDEELLRRTREGKHIAILAAIEGDAEGFTLLNAWRYRDPYGPPLIQVPIREWPNLERAARENRVAQIRVGASHEETTIFNVRTRIPGKDSRLAPLVVLTPRSGWWHCAGERGGGLAIWLELARVLAGQPLDRDVIFLATTGHEIGYLGIHLFLEADASFATAAHFWLHLGANIGAADSRLVVRTGDEALMESIQTACQPRVPSAAFNVTQTPAGEAGVVVQYGGRFASFIGAGFPLFHSVNDRWPHACDFPAMVNAAEAALGILRSA